MPKGASPRAPPRVLDGIIHPHDGEAVSDANILTRLTFGRASKLVCCVRPKKVPLSATDKLDKKYKGKTTKNGPLFEQSDLFRFTDNEAHDNWKQFKPYWEEELTREKPSLIRALRRSFWQPIFACYMLYLVYVLFSLAVPVLMPFMMRHLKDLSEPSWQGYLYLVIVVVAAVLAALHFYQAGFYAWTLVAKLRSVLVILTYKKSLRVANVDGSKDTGRIVNMVGTDAQIMSDTMSIVFQGLIAPVQLAIITGLLWREVGPFSLIPLGVFILSLPFTFVLDAYYGTIVENTKASTDARLKLVREFISAIRIVKYYAWERAFQRNITEYREREVERFKKTAFLRISFVSVFGAVPPLATGLLFSLYAIGNELNIDRIFTAIALLNQLRVPLNFLPLIVIFWNQYNVAFSRIEEFALLPELPKREKTSTSSKSDLVVRFKKVNLAWEKHKTILSNVNLKVKRGTVTMIVGSVGSGKSTLASAVLREVSFMDGEHEVHGSTAYVPQDAWIINATVRDNILFGKPFDEQLYRRVLSASALETDLKIMPAGDQTEIGDRGINLSGGQRQRVSIARSLYADRDLIVLDDPLSAVDSHVAAHLVEHMLKGYIKNQGKTAVMVTNQLQFLPAADQVVLLMDGRIAEIGTFQQLMANGKEFTQLINDFGGMGGEEKKHELSEDDPQLLSPPMERLARNGSKEEEKSTLNYDAPVESTEERESGAVSFGVFWYYIRAGGVSLYFFAAFLMVVIAALRVFYSIWLSWWASPDPAVSGQFSKETWIAVYMSGQIIEALLFFLRQVPIVQWTRNGSLAVHRNLLSALARASTSFFDATPMGRILSRFSKDMYLIDDGVAFELDFYLQQCLTLAALFIQMATSQPYLLIVIGGGFVIFYVFQTAFQRSAVEIQRLEAISRAPIYSHLSESIEGAASIRAYGLQKAFSRASINKVNANIVDYLSLHYSTSWFGLRLDLVGTCIVFATLLSVFLTRNMGTVDIALAALALSSTSAITSTLSSVAVFRSNVEIMMNSVERVRQYTDVEQEAPEHIKETMPAKSWPEEGAVHFKNLTIQYTEGAPVLNDITAKIKPREKIGIVGRTGAGKSTLITALFRMVEPAGGKIMIDGVDILELGLSDLRSKLAIIPQLPQLFIGTIRYNIDPFGEATDDQIWHALGMVRLKEFVAALDGQLDAPVDENGSNFSQGQRQLIAMARALLRDAKVLLLDEATAAVDNETDGMIQAMVRKNFKDKTVLTIAHRLNTIMDYSRVLVLDKGKVVEFDTPSKLLDNTDGIFTSMVNATGPANAEHLRKIARGEICQCK